MFVEIRNPFAVELLNYRVTHFENYPEKAYSRWRHGRADWTQGPKPAEHTIVELELRPSGRTIKQTVSLLLTNAKAPITAIPIPSADAKQFSVQ